MKRNFFYVLFIFNTCFLFSQEINSSSDVSIFPGQLPDSVKFYQILNKADKFYFNNKKDSIFYYLDKSLSVANDLKNEAYIAESHYLLGIYFEENNNYKKAIENYKKALVYFNASENFQYLGLIHNYLGYCYTNLYAEDKAISHYLKSINYFKKINDDDGLAMNMNDIGNLYYDQANYLFAKKYFFESLEIYKKRNDSVGIATSYTNLGNAFCDDGNLEKGMDYYHKSVEISRILNDEYGIAINYNNLGDSYIELQDYDKARFYFSSALNKSKDFDDIDFQSVLHLNVSDVQNKSKNYKSAIVSAEKGLKLAKKIGKIDYEVDFYENLAVSYEGLNDNEKSISFYKKHNKLRDSIFNLDKLKKVQLFNKLNELEEQEFKMSELAAENKLAKLKVVNEKKFIYALIFVLVVFGILMVFLINQQTSKKKAYNLLAYKNHQINRMHDEIKEQSEFLKQLNVTKDRFFSIIAHDLKNPFNSIKGFTELLIDNDDEYDKEKRLKFLKIVKGSTTKASNLLDNLLVWANSQSGNLKYNPSIMNLRDCVASVFSLLEIQAINKDIQLLNEIDNDVFIKADENMIDTIFRNLISNAIKFTEVGGKVKVCVLKKNGFVEIMIKDNGIGISEKEIPNLFSIDVKNSNVGTANEQGSGLGLILCKEFVEKHGGDIRVESKVGKGSKFIFTIPSSK